MADGGGSRLRSGRALHTHSRWTAWNPRLPTLPTCPPPLPFMNCWDWRWEPDFGHCANRPARRPPTSCRLQAPHPCSQAVGDAPHPEAGKPGVDRWRGDGGAAWACGAACGVGPLRAAARRRRPLKGWAARRGGPGMRRRSLCFTHRCTGVLLVLRVLMEKKTNACGLIMARPPLAARPAAGPATPPARPPPPPPGRPGPRRPTAGVWLGWKAGHGQSI